jgi:hypothetical protein
MELQIMAIPTEKVEPLKNSVHSYVKWAKKMERLLKANPVFTKVVAYAVNGNDEVVEELKLLAGNSEVTQEKNKERRDLKRKFEIASSAFIGQLTSTMTEPVIRLLESKNEYNSIVSQGKARDFWDLIKTVLIETNSTGPKLIQAENYLERVKQEKGENFDDYADRFNDVVKEIELLGGIVSATIQTKRFIQGINLKYRRVKEKLLDNLDIYDKSVFEIARIADSLLQTQRNFFETYRVFPGQSNFKDEKVVAAMTTKDDKKTKVVCWKCGKEGHVQRECKSAQINTNKDKSTPKAYLDTLASVSLTNQLGQLKDVITAERQFTNANGELQGYELEGDHPLLGRTAYLENAPMTIASFANVREGYKPTYLDEHDTFCLENRKTHKMEYEARQRDGIYPIQPITGNSVCHQKICGMQVTQSSCKELQELHQRLLHTNQVNLRKSINLGHYQDVIKASPASYSDWNCVINCITCRLYKDGRLLDQQRGKGLREAKGYN